MKRLIMAWLLLPAFMLVSARSRIFNNPGNMRYWGVRASLDVSIPRDFKFSNGNSAKMFRSGAGASAGVVLNTPLVANLFFEPGLGLYYNTYRYDDLVITDNSGQWVESDPQVVKAGVRVPLMLGFRFDINNSCSVSVFTGPELSYSFWGKVRYEHDSEATEYMPEVFGKDGQRRYNVACNVGAAFEYNFHWYVSATGSIGLNDLEKSDARYRENRFSLAVGYNF